MTDLLTTSLDERVIEHVIYRLMNAPLLLYPYPHFFVRDVFPADFYYDLARTINGATDYASEDDGRYHGRQFARQTLPTEIDGFRGFFSKRFLKAALMPFRVQLEERYGKNSVSVYSDARFIRDGRGYYIGPHTDAPWKLLSFLFYLPRDSFLESYGTSIYVPRDPAFTCRGGPHHDFAGFTRVWTAPFVPNSCFGFLKTEKSFHGVERIAEDVQRDVFLFNVYDQAIYEQTHKKPSNTSKDEQPAAPSSET